MIFYNVMTFNVAAMLDNCIVRQQDDTHNKRPEFKYDFNEKITKDLILSSIDLHADNALFYQLIASQYGEKNIDIYRRQQDCILKSLIYMDFKKAFSGRKKKEKPSEFIDDWNVATIDEYCSVLFEDGFSIIYEDGEVKTYIPFDKSGSMSRNYSITFVDKDIFSEVDRRLRLGIDFSSIKVVLSKYFAYRGLYLTDSVRIDEDPDHVLDHNTVLVIEDDTHDYMLKGEVQKVLIITADEQQLLQDKFVSVEKEDSIRLNSFDGEGLVSPFFAEYMNRIRQQEVYLKRPGVSFQIRMPYIKGMLHQVDFHRFFKEQLPENDYYIKDIFGIPRRIDDVQIVLTKSMFKCAGWLDDYCRIHPEIKDPMEWFFNMFHLYNHALYVCGTDSNMGSKRVSLTYQFLNTMAIDPVQLDNLIKRHLNEAHSITKTGAKYAVDMEEYNAEASFEDEFFSSSIPAWRYALSLNSDFVKDPYVREKLKLDELALVKGVCKGQINVDGVLKYLSGDLLALLIHMIYNKKAENDDGIGTENGLGIKIGEEFQIDAKTNKAVVARLRSQLIRTGKFYTADHARLELQTGKRYGILRSPHLSRNEQCALRPFIPEKEDENNVYNRYFSHLKNIVMLPYESIDALSLGGADYDGDKVKIILDRTVNTAILNGAYKLKGKDYVRKLPVVQIPSLKDNRKPTPEIISYELVKRTFSNRVGEISNLAIRIGKKVYASNNNAQDLHNMCAECTLATGLEIDAVKTGRSPDLKNLQKQSPQAKDYYLDRKKIVEGVEPEQIGRLSVDFLKIGEIGDYKGELYSLSRPQYSDKKKTSKKQFNAVFIPLDTPAAVIDRLPGYFLKDLYEARKKEAEPAPEKKTGRPKEILLFKFQVDEATGMPDSTWKKRITLEDRDKQKNTDALVKAYRKVASDAYYIRKQNTKAAHSNNKNKIWSLMWKLFDVNTERLPQTHTMIGDAIEIAGSDLRNIFETKGEVDKAIERMEAFDWIFTSQEEREEVLYKILGTNSLEEETKEILLCNEPDAFNFLIFYLYEIRNDLTRQSTVDEQEIGAQGLAKYLKGYSVEDYREFIREYLAGQTNKESKRIWNARVIDMCRGKLAATDMFENDFDRALKYYYSCRSGDPGRRFLWEVFKTTEIIRNVYIKPKE